MQRSDDVSELVKALVAAQAAMANPVFDKTNPHFKNAYASMAHVRNMVVPVLAAQGLVITQHLSSNDEGVLCETVLWHTSGQYLSEQLFMPAQGTPQAFGSASSYARRYSLMALCNVVGDEDDDGEAASTKTMKTMKTMKNTAKTHDRDESTEGGDAQLRALVMTQIASIFLQQGVTSEKVAEWWAKRTAVFGDPLPLPKLQELLKDLATAQAKHSARRQGAAWTTLTAHQDNPTVPMALRMDIKNALETPGVSEARALELAGAVHDWVSQHEEAWP